MIDENWVILGVVISLLGSWSYLIDTLKGKVKPNKVSWLLWSIAPLIAAYAQFKQGVGLIFLTTFIVGFIPLVIFIASFFNKNAEWIISRFDITCGLLSVLGLIVWQITKVGNIAIFFSILADGLAALPTIIKSYHEPESENDTIFWYGAVNSIIGLLTISVWKFEYWGFPLYLLFVNLIIANLVRFKVGKRFA